jgi:hypothetical protein
VFRQHSAGLVRIRADILQKPKVKSAWDAILSDACLAKSKTSVTDVSLENIIMLYIWGDPSLTQTMLLRK